MFQVTITAMKKGRLKENDSLTFSRGQVYLILGCIAAIAILAFSLGHMVSKPEQQAEEKTARLQSTPISEAEVQKEIDQLDKRLNLILESDKDEKGSGGKKKELRSMEVEFSFPEKLKEEGRVITKVDGEKVTEDGKVKIKTVEKVKPKKQPMIASKEITTKVFKVSKTKKVTEAKKEAVSTKPATVEPPAPAPKTDKMRIKPSKAPPVVAETMPETASKPTPPVTNPKFTVQVASFPSKSEAQKLARNLKKKGYNSYVQKQAKSKSVWYRVRVGAYENRSEAKRMMEIIKERVGHKAIVEKYIRP